MESSHCPTSIVNTVPKEFKAHRPQTKYCHHLPTIEILISLLLLRIRNAADFKIFSLIHVRDHSLSN